MPAHATIPAWTMAGEEGRLSLMGCFDAGNVHALRPRLEALVASPVRRVVLDFSAVASMDGSGLGAIAFLFKRLVASGRELAVTGATGQPLDLLTQLGLIDLLGLPAKRAARRRSLGWFGSGMLARSH